MVIVICILKIQLFSGARHGPSLMPGGSPEAWPYIKDIFQAIAAKVDNESCCDWVKLFHLHFNKPRKTNWNRHFCDS